MFDAHCHLDDPRLPSGVEESLTQARAMGVTGFIIPGVGPAGWGAQAEIAARHGDVWVSYGLHPWAITDLLRGEKSTLDLALEALGEAVDGGIKGVAPVAIGELGLDGLPRNKATLPSQILAFRHQLALARERDLPLVLHIVRAHGAAIDILKSDGLPKAGGMVHSMSGSREVGEIYTGLGLHLSFGGSITNPRARGPREAAQSCPRHRILIETDAPDQTPIQHRPGLNEPRHLVSILESLADILGEDVSTLEARTVANTRALFRL